jgi:hypothetical protein
MPARAGCVDILGSRSSVGGDVVSWVMWLGLAWLARMRGRCEERIEKERGVEGVLRGCVSDGVDFGVNDGRRGGVVCTGVGVARLKRYETCPPLAEAVRAL